MWKDSYFLLLEHVIMTLSILGLARDFCVSFIWSRTILQELCSWRPDHNSWAGLGLKSLHGHLLGLATFMLEQCWCWSCLLVSKTNFSSEDLNKGFPSTTLTTRRAERRHKSRAGILQAWAGIACRPVRIGLVIHKYFYFSVRHSPRSLLKVTLDMLGLAHCCAQDQ